MRDCAKLSLKSVHIDSVILYNCENFFHTRPNWHVACCKLFYLCVSISTRVVLYQIWFCTCIYWLVSCCTLFVFTHGHIHTCDTLQVFWTLVYIDRWYTLQKVGWSTCPYWHALCHTKYLWTGVGLALCTVWNLFFNCAPVLIRVRRARVPFTVSYVTYCTIFPGVCVETPKHLLTIVRSA